MQRFFVEPAVPLVPGAAWTFPPPLTHQIGHVLRLRPGDHVLLLDNSGDEWEVELNTFTRAAVQGRVLARRPGPPEPGPRVTLYQCLLKGEKFDWVLQKATELGVTAIVPVVSARTVPVPAGDAGKPARWSRIVREAAEQSRRACLPTLTAPLAWPAAISAAHTAGGLALVPWEAAPAGPGLAGLLAQARAAGQVALFIGPEGGLTAEEVTQAGAAGVRPVSLGPRILRAETAALAALALLLIPE